MPKIPADYLKRAIRFTVIENYYFGQTVLQIFLNIYYHKIFMSRLKRSEPYGPVTDSKYVRTKRPLTDGAIITTKLSTAFIEEVPTSFNDISAKSIDVANFHGKTIVIGKTFTPLLSSSGPFTADPDIIRRFVELTAKHLDLQCSRVQDKLKALEDAFEYKSDNPTDILLPDAMLIFNFFTVSSIQASIKITDTGFIVTNHGTVNYTEVVQDPQGDFLNIANSNFIKLEAKTNK